jgi:proteasome alpha subunit
MEVQSMPEIRVVVSDELDRYMDTIVNKGMFGSKAELIRASLIRYFETLPLRVPSGYDDTTLFSPDGRIFQIEYAFESALRGNITVGLRYHDGVLLAKQIEPLLGHFPEHIVSGPWEKYRIDEHIGAIPSGIASDFLLIEDRASQEAKTHREKTGQPIGVEDLVKRLALFVQSFTMKKDGRPLGCIVFIGGVDETEPHLFALDPSGTYNEILYQVIGYQSAETQQTIEANYKSELSLHEALVLVIKAVLKEETRKPEELSAAVIETKTKKLRKVTLDEMKEAWKTVFKEIQK